MSPAGPPDPAPVTLDVQGPVALITMARPERRNALDHATLVLLREALADSAGARVVVLTGAGEHFCAGADLTGVEDEGFAIALRSVLDAIGAHQAPVIAAVAGAALGAGTQLAAACDLRVAKPDARFGMVQRLALLAGAGPARAMLLAAETIEGIDAHRLGFVQRLGSLQDAMHWAGEIAELAPLTIAGHKLMLNRLERELGDDAEVDAAFTRAWSSADLSEGMAAFRERRKPTFDGH
jgi:enoyl-CoA hydratase